MINKISNFGYNVNKFLFYRTICKYSTDVHEKRSYLIPCNVQSFTEKKVDVKYSNNGGASIQNSILNAFYSIGDQTVADNIIVRKNDGD